MQIKLSPIASNKTSQVSVAGEVLTIDGADYDLSVIPDGGQVEASLPALGVIKRVDGVIELAIVYHYDSELAEPMQSTNEADYIVDVISGEVTSPIKWGSIEPIIEDVEEEELSV